MEGTWRDLPGDAREGLDHDAYRLAQDLDPPPMGGDPPGRRGQRRGLPARRDAVGRAHVAPGSKPAGENVTEDHGGLVLDPLHALGEIRLERGGEPMGAAPLVGPQGMARIAALGGGSAPTSGPVRSSRPTAPCALDDGAARCTRACRSPPAADRPRACARPRRCRRRRHTECGWKRSSWTSAVREWCQGQARLDWWHRPDREPARASPEESWSSPGAPAASMLG